MMICPSSVFTTARSLRRVVCATGLVMAIFSPMQALTNVDLPTLGLPTSAQNPLLKGASFVSMVRVPFLS